MSPRSTRAIFAADLDIRMGNYDPPAVNGTTARWDPSRNISPPSTASSSANSSPRPTRLTNDIHAMAPFFPNGERSLAGIAVRAFCLGGALMLSILAVLYILLVQESPHPIWRAPFFLGALSVFHFLEFWVTAQRNTMVANVDSFLLTQNWPSYAIAHSLAFLEAIVVSVFFPSRSWAPLNSSAIIISIGLLTTLVGQIVRTVAMYQAGASFNHQVQSRKAESHTLVTRGLYGWIRHPSYFGFFYWGLGTQLVLGNVFCFVAYAAVLWFFFSKRIEHEEGKLVEFFREDYVAYRKRVPTWIPFIR